MALRMNGEVPAQTAVLGVQQARGLLLQDHIIVYPLQVPSPRAVALNMWVTPPWGPTTLS